MALSKVAELFLGIEGKGKEKEKRRNWWEKEKSWFLGNGERLIKMTTFKKTRTPLIELCRIA